MSRARVVVGTAAASMLAAAHVLLGLVLGAGPAAAHGEGGPPAKGNYTVVAEDVPVGVTVTMLQGRKPGVFLQASARRTVEVIGEDGKPVARATPRTSQVSWLDERLRPPSQPPADPGADAMIGRWVIPVRVDGQLDVLAGEVRWVSLGYPPHKHGPAWYVSWPVTAGAVALSLMCAIAVAVIVDRRRSRAVVAVF